MAPTSLKQFLSVHSIYYFHSIPFHSIHPPQSFHKLSLNIGQEEAVDQLTSVVIRVGDRKLVSFVTLGSIRFSFFCFCHKLLLCFSFIHKKPTLLHSLQFPPTFSVMNLGVFVGGVIIGEGNRSATGETTHDVC